MKTSWAIGLLSALLILIFVGYDIHLQKEYLYEETRADARNLVKLVESDLSRTIGSFSQIFSSLEEHLEAHHNNRMDSPGVRRVIDELVLRNNYLSALLILDSQGQVLHWNNNFQKPDLSQRNYFHFHKVNYFKGLYIGLPQPSLLNQEQMIAGISKAIHNQNQSLDKVLVAIIDLKYFQRQYLSLFDEPGMTLTISSPAGHIYARIPDRNGLVGQQRQAYGSNEEATEARNKLAVQQAVNDYPFLVTVEMDPTTLVSAWKDKTFLLVITSGAFVLGLLLLTCHNVCYRRRQRDAMEKLRMDSLHDPETQLLNLDKALDQAKLEIKRANRTKAPFSVIMVGLENTSPSDLAKSSGNRKMQMAEVLESTAEVVRKSSRETDILSRYGDHEFLLFLPDTDMQGAMIYARKVCDNLKKRHCTRSGREFNVTFGIGVTQWAPTEADLSGALHRVDSALYEARKSGSNAIRWIPHNLGTEDTSSTVVWLHTKTGQNYKTEASE